MDRRQFYRPSFYPQPPVPPQPSIPAPGQSYSAHHQYHHGGNGGSVQLQSTPVVVPVTNESCLQLVQDMNQYGICVLDNILGEPLGNAILEEVQAMYSVGAFQDGQLVASSAAENPFGSRIIRGDKTKWVDGSEPYCPHIAKLMKHLDDLITGACSLANGALGGFKITGRSQAMVACYPGNGTHYVKHVDNPNGDGRCVTAIYYLNKNWSTQESGGLLRIFPEGSTDVANIEPIFDRVLFFWSDRRNPHEVQPAYRTRYAITLWYYNSTQS